MSSRSTSTRTRVLSQAFNILSIPMIAFFKPGSPPQGAVGFRPLEQLEQTFSLAEFAAGRSRLTLTRPRTHTTPVIDRGRSIPGAASSRGPRRRWAEANQATARSAA